MRRINLKEEPKLRRRIKVRFSMRGLTFDPESVDNWEVHESQEGRVFVGLAYKSQESPNNSFYVALYPNAVYWIDSPCDWWKVRPDRRVYLQFPYASRRHLDNRT